MSQAWQMDRHKLAVGPGDGMENVGPRSMRGWPEREVRPGCRDPEVRRFALVTESK